jgi:hypothetical protein
MGGFALATFRRNTESLSPCSCWTPLTYGRRWYRAPKRFAIRPVGLSQLPPPHPTQTSGGQRLATVDRVRLPSLCRTSCWDDEVIQMVLSRQQSAGRIPGILAMQERLVSFESSPFFLLIFTVGRPPPPAAPNRSTAYRLTEVQGDRVGRPPNHSREVQWDRVGRPLPLHRTAVRITD